LRKGGGAGNEKCLMFIRDASREGWSFQAGGKEGSWGARRAWLVVLCALCVGGRGLLVCDGMLDFSSCFACLLRSAKINNKGEGRHDGKRGEEEDTVDTLG